MKRLTAPTKRPIRVAPTRANIGLEIAYQQSIDRMIVRLHQAVLRAVTASWKRKPPEMAEDESPAAALQAMMRNLGREWLSCFDEFARDRGRKFGDDAARQTDRSFMIQLRKAGFTVKFQATKAWNDVKQATIHANVGLIKSIPAEHLQAVEGIVMRGVQTGRDLHTISEELQHQFGVTKRRAAFIARDQSNKATAAITRVRQTECGITEAIWLHSSGGRHPRPEHVAFSGQRYRIDKGAFLEGKWVWPGTEPNCFPGDMPVRLTGSILTLWRTPFYGPMVHFDIGADLLKGTLNHPVLTRHGWIPLDDIQNGDEVVCMVKQGGDVVYDQESDHVTTFSELFESHAIVRGYIRRYGGSFDFHGHIPDHNVDEIIVVDHNLRSDLVAAAQNFSGFSFSKSDAMPALAISGGIEEVLHPNATRLSDGSLAVCRRRSRESSNIGGASLSRDTLLDDDAPNIGSGIPRSPQNLGDSRGSEAGLVKVDNPGAECLPVESLIGSDAHGAELFAEFISRMPNNSSGVFQFGAVLYEFRRVSNKRIRDFSGHVFTMETSPGHYSVGDALVQAKNCRCVSKSIIPGLE